MKFILFFSFIMMSLLCSCFPNNKTSSESNPTKPNVPDDTINAIPKSVEDEEYWVPDWLAGKTYTSVGAFLSPSLSPSGKWVFYANNRAGLDTLYIFDILEKKSYVAHIKGSSSPEDITWLSWAGDEKIFFRFRIPGSANSTYHILDVSHITKSHSNEYIEAKTDLKLSLRIVEKFGFHRISPTGKWLFAKSIHPPAGNRVSDTGIIVNLNTLDEYTAYTSQISDSGLWSAHAVTTWIGEESLFMVNEFDTLSNRLKAGILDVSAITKNASKARGSLTELELPVYYNAGYGLGAGVRVSPMGAWLQIWDGSRLKLQLQKISTGEIFNVIEYRGANGTGPHSSIPWVNEDRIAYTRRVSDESSQSFRYEFRLLNMAYIIANN